MLTPSTGSKTHQETHSFYTSSYKAQFALTRDCGKFQRFQNHLMLHLKHPCMNSTRLTGVGFTHHQAITILLCSSTSLVRALPKPWGPPSIVKEHKNCKVFQGNKIRNKFPLRFVSRSMILRGSSCACLYIFFLNVRIPSCSNFFHSMAHKYDALNSPTVLFPTVINPF